MGKTGVTAQSKWEIRFKDVDLKKFGQDDAKQVGGAGYGLRTTFSRAVAKGWSAKLDVTTAALVNKNLSGVTATFVKPGKASLSYTPHTKDIKAEASSTREVRGRKFAAKVSTAQNLGKGIDPRNVTLQVSTDAGNDKKITSIYSHKTQEETVKLWMKLSGSSSIEPSVKLKSKEVSVTATQKLDGQLGTLSGTLKPASKGLSVDWALKPFKLTLEARDFTRPTCLQMGITYDAVHAL